MKWAYFSVTDDAGIEEGIPCSVCGRIQKDILYVSQNMNLEQARWIKVIWNCDPYTDFTVCEECMEGHCGAGNYSLNANTWLEKQIRKYKKEKP